MGLVDGTVLVGLCDWFWDQAMWHTVGSGSCETMLLVLGTGD